VHYRYATPGMPWQSFLREGTWRVPVIEVEGLVQSYGRGTVRALGLHRIGDTVVVPDNDATRGMVRQVRFLVTVEEIAGDVRRKE